MDKLEFTNKVLTNLNNCMDELGKVNLTKFTELTNKQYEAITVTPCCTELVCVGDGDLPNLTQDNIYKMIVESNSHYNIIDDNGNDVLVRKKYFRKLKKAN